MVILEGELLTTDETIEYLKLTRGNFNYHRNKRHLIPVSQIGGANLYLKSDLDAFRTNRRPQGRQTGWRKVKAE